MSQEGRADVFGHTKICQIHVEKAKLDSICKERNTIPDERVKMETTENVINPIPKELAKACTICTDFNQILKELSEIDTRTDHVFEKGTQPDTCGTETISFSVKCFKPDITDEKVSQVPVEETKPDFSLLPEEVWLEVFMLLPICYRCTVSQTCKRLYNLFNAADTVWKSVFLTTEKKSRGKFGFGEMACLKRRQQSLLEKFGHRIANLTINTLDFVIESSSHRSILSLTKWKKLRSLTICLTRRPDGNPSLCHSEEDDLLTVDSLISGVCSNLPKCAVNIDFKHVGRLRTLYSNILQGSSSELCCRHLRSLKMHQNDYPCCEAVLGEYAPQPTSSPTPDVVSRFPHLQHLTIWNTNLSDRLLGTLAEMSEKNGTFRTLNLIVKDTDLEVATSAAWIRLVEACPKLQVSCYFPTSFQHAGDVFKPEIPLIGVYLQCRLLDDKLDSFLSLCGDFRHTLKTVVCVPNTLYHYPDVDHLGRAFISTVNRCPNLTDMHFGGPIQSEDVKELAKLSRRWRSFKITGPVVKKTDVCATGKQTFESLTTSETAGLERTVSRQLNYLKPWKVIREKAHFCLLDTA